ncbi:MAG: copper chaperone PCu(A)C [Colwelliaceae bacterium]|nr:copper chaperone PCu(A)C [Colwelliaceae bacterium]
MKKLIEQLKRSFVFVSLIVSVFLSTSTLAKDLSVEHGYLRATIPGTSVSSAYMEITNKTNNDLVLIGASSNISNRIEIHEHIMSDEMMRMRQRESLMIPANDHVVLQPSGYHLMIFNLNTPLKVDDKVELTLHFSENKDMIITLPVESIKRKKQEESANHHHH